MTAAAAFAAIETSAADRDGCADGVEPSDEDPRMDITIAAAKTYADVPVEHLPYSAPEVMGDGLLQGLRRHAPGLLLALSKSKRLRRDHPEVLDDVERLAEHVETLAASILTRMAEVAGGVPGPGESLSPGPHAPAHGDYRPLNNGCKIWMGSLDGKGLPVLGRWTKFRDNRPAVIHWKLAHGPQSLPEGLVLVRTCEERLCIAHEHGELVTREELAARSVGSRLDWEAVRDIRAKLTVSTASIEELSVTYEISVGAVKDIFRGKTWRDPNYEPGAERTCAACSASYKTTNTCRLYCSGDCMRKAFAERQRRRRGDCEPSPRQLRDGQRLRRELDEARAEFEPHLDREVKATWGRSLDAVLGETRSTLHDVLADANADDPAFVLEAKYIREVLGDLTEDEVDDLSEEKLVFYRERLDAAGLSPSTSAAVG